MSDTIESDIVAALEADAAVAALVADRICPLRVGQHEARPYLAWRVVSKERPRILNGGGVSGLCRVRFQIDAFGDDYASSVAVANAVRKAIDGRPQVIGPTVKTVALEDEDDTEQDIGGGTGDVVFRRSLDFFIWHKED